MRSFGKEHAAALAGNYRQSAQQWLGTSWQGDALQVCTQCTCISPQLGMSSLICTRLIIHSSRCAAKMQHSATDYA